MAKKPNALGIEQTPATVILKGVVRLPKESYTESISGKGQPIRKFQFGIETEKDNIVYTEIFAMQNDAYAYSKAEQKTEKVGFKDIPLFEKEGYNIIGTRSKIGKVEKNLVEWYMTEFLANNLTEGMSVFVNAEIQFRSYTNDEGITKIQKTIVPKAIYESSKVIDFESELGQNVLNLDMIYIGIEQDKENQKFDLDIKYVAYKDILDIPLVIRDVNLAKSFKTKLKPYTMITVSGKVVNKVELVQVQEDNGWGSFESTKTVKNYTTELLITGADPSTIDKEKYSEKVIEEALSKKEVKATANNDGFGKFETSTEMDDSFPF